MKRLVLVLSVLSLSARAQPQVPLGGDYWQHSEAPAGEVWGIADLHAHFVNHLGFGGRVLHGLPWAPGGMPQALANCRADHGDDGRGSSRAMLPEPSHRTGGYPTFEGWPRYDTLIHQQAYVDWVRRAWLGGVRLVQLDIQNTGFLGKTYGAVNGLFIRGPLTPVPLDDVSALELQAGAARLLFNDGPASDFAALAYSSADARRIIASGKLAVVLGIEVEALGNLSTRAQLGPNPRDTIGRLVALLKDTGVRHVIPIHLTHNAFGQPAVFDPVLNAMNYADTGEFYVTGEAFERGVRFDPRRVPAEPASSLVEVLGALHGHAAYPSARAIAATEGLTPEGVLLIEALLAHGLIVDVEHMSEQGVNQTLALAAAAKVPVMSSHTHFRDLSFGTRVTFLDGGYDAAPLEQPFGDDDTGAYGTSDARKVRTDRSRTRAQLEAIAALGGMVGVQLVSAGVGVSWRGRIPLDCDGSSKGFLQAWSYAQELLGTQGAVAIATDVGGFATMPAPRFGVDACPGARGDAVRRANARIRSQALSQQHGVQYRSALTSFPAWRFEPRGRGADVAFDDDELTAWRHLSSRAPPANDVVAARLAAMSEGPNVPLARSVAGAREFDVNLDGMAHYGMLPDFLQDASNVARASGQPTLLTPLFRSAEQYLQLWARVEAHAAKPSSP